MNKFNVLLALILLGIFVSCSDSEGEKDVGLSDSLLDIADEDVLTLDNYVPDKRPPTTVRQTVKAELPIEPQEKSLSDKFGKYSMNGEGESHIERDDLGTKRGNAEEKSFFYMVHLSDLHITDFQSPDRMVKYDSPSIPSAYRPFEGYSPRILDEFIKTINDFNWFRPVDILLITGDGVDNTQYNEFKWLIGILNGEEVNPNSGGYKTLIDGPDNEVCDPLKATGARFPWIYVLGNHDQLIVGNFPAVDRSLPPDEQETAIKEGNYYKKAVGDQSDAVIGCKYPVDVATVRAGKVNSNEERRPLTHRQAINMFYTAGGLVKGHGFTEENIKKDSGNYVYSPAGDIPIRFIVMDTGKPDGFDKGYLSQSLFNDFLKPELDRSLNDKVLVIVASHHPTWSIDSKSEKSGEELIALLNQYPNVLLHLVGHGHEHRVVPHPSPDADITKGYYEVETTSTLDFPQQGNIYEFVYSGDNVVTIYKTVFDHNSKEGSMAYIARGIAISDIQDGSNPDNGMGEKTDRNVILNKKIPSDIATRLESLPKKWVETQNFYK
ncbi:MAG: metallophosphoesterase family protein [Myxococcota bacterium]